MGSRRMLSIDVVETDLFLFLPHSAQCLYFHLCLNADDDGFVRNPKTVSRLVCCKESDLQQLIDKEFIIPFQSGVIVVRHWKIQNTIQKDRYHSTQFQREFSQLGIDENNTYFLKTDNDSILDTDCIQDVSNPIPEVKLSKDNLSKANLIEDKPNKDNPEKTSAKGAKEKESMKGETIEGHVVTLQEMKAYCIEKDYSFDVAKVYSVSKPVTSDQMEEWCEAQQSFHYASFH